MISGRPACILAALLVIPTMAAAAPAKKKKPVHKASQHHKATAPKSHGAAPAAAANRVPIVLPGLIDHDMTLTRAQSPYIAHSDVSIDNNATLTIEPGVFIKFDQGIGMDVGSNASMGFLKAKGLDKLADGKDGHIYFGPTQPNPTRGFWGGVRFRNSAYRAVMDYCVLSNGGMGQDTPVLIVSDGNAPTITHCEIAWGDSDGVVTNGTGSFTTFDYNNLNHLKGRAMYVSARAAGGIGPHNVLKENVKNVIEVTGGLDVDEHWTNNTVPFYVSDNLSISGTAEHTTTLTLDPGVKLLFAEGISLECGSNDAIGTLIAKGTAEEPIVFSSFKRPATPGQWSGIFLHNCGRSVMDHCVVENSDIGIRYRSGDPSITNCAIVRSGKMGFQAEQKDDTDPGLVQAFKGNTITGGLDVPVEVPITGVSAIDPENQLVGNTDDVIRVVGQYVKRSAVWPVTAVPYFVTEGISIDATAEGATASLTLSPGVRVLFPEDGEIEIGNNNRSVLNAVGTPQQPIVFSIHSKEPHSGDWKGIWLRNSSQNTDIENARIEYAGKEDAAVWANDEARGSFKNVTIAHSKSGGFKLGASTVTQTGSVFEDLGGPGVIKPDDQ